MVYRVGDALLKHRTRHAAPSNSAGTPRHGLRRSAGCGDPWGQTLRGTRCRAYLLLLVTLGSLGADAQGAEPVRCWVAPSVAGAPVVALADRVWPHPNAAAVGLPMGHALTGVVALSPQTHLVTTTRGVFVLDRAARPRLERLRGELATAWAVDVWASPDVPQLAWVATANTGRASGIVAVAQWPAWRDLVTLSLTGPRLTPWFSGLRGHGLTWYAVGYDAQTSELWRATARGWERRRVALPREVADVPPPSLAVLAVDEAGGLYVRVRSVMPGAGDVVLYSADEGRHYQRSLRTASPITGMLVTPAGAWITSLAGELWRVRAGQVSPVAGRAQHLATATPGRLWACMATASGVHWFSMSNAESALPGGALRTGGFLAR